MSILSAAQPYIYRQFEDEFLDVGARMSLSCGAAGTPSPVVSWTLDDQPLVPPSSANDDDGRVVVGSVVAPDGDVISYVNVTSVRLSDGGLYRCTAANSVGSVSHEKRINIYGTRLEHRVDSLTACSISDIV